MDNSLRIKEFATGAHFQLRKDTLNGSNTDNRYYTWKNYVEYGPNRPNYRRLIALGECATTHLSGHATSVFVAGNGSASLVAHTVPSFPIPLKIGISASGNLTYAPVPPVSLVGDVADVDSQAMAKFLNNARSAQTKFQGLVVTGEFRKTGNLIQGTARSLARSVEGYLNKITKISRKLSPKQLLREASNRYLEAVFGWQPLIHDINDAARSLAEDPDLMRDREIITSKVEATGRTLPVVGSAANVDQLSWQWDLITEWKVSVTYIGAVRRFYDGEPFQVEPLRRLGFNLRSFLPSAWELLPWSFVVDYFTNIGDLIGAYSQGTSDVFWVQRTQRVENILRPVNVTLLDHNLNPSIWEVDKFQLLPDEFIATSSSVNRDETDPVNLIPTLRFKIPGFESRKWLNLAALTSIYGTTRASWRARFLRQSGG